MKKAYHTIKLCLRTNDRNSNNANTNNRPYCKKTTYKEALLHTKHNGNNQPTESFYKNKNNNLSRESTKAIISIKDIIIDDYESLPDLAERYDSETEDDEDDDDKYNIQEQRREIRNISTKHKTNEEALQNQFEPTLCMSCLHSSKSINLQVIRKLKCIFHCGQTKVIIYSFNNKFQSFKTLLPNESISQCSF